MHYKMNDITLDLPPSIPEGVDVDEDILQRTFQYIIIGRPGAGKSTLIKNLLFHEKLYFKKFHKVLFMTPSGISGIELDSSNWVPSLNLDWLDRKLREESELGKEKNITRNILIVIDDLVSSLDKNKNDEFLVQIFYNRRHLLPNIHICLIVTTQKWSKIPSGFRVVATGLFLFAVPPKELKAIKEELSIARTIRLDPILKAIWSSKHHFFYYNFNKDTLFHNFDQIIL